MKIATINGLSYYACWDDSAEVFEVFYGAPGDTYCGCADTIAECEELVKSHATDMLCR